MSINLVTGTPGAGKTLYVVRELVEKLLPQNRPIFHNIAGLNVQSPLIEEIDDEGIKEWFGKPDHSIFIFDECQRNFPPRNPMAAVPRHVSEFETHRHKGMDFYLITQGPTLIDRHIHPLVETHVHLYRPFGLKRSTVFKWNTVNPSPNPRQSRLTSQTRNFAFPKKLYGLYKSASQHTIAARPPWLLLLAVPLLLVLIVGAGLYFRSFMFDRMAGAKADELAAAGSGEAAGSGAGADTTVAAGAPCALIVALTGSRARLLVNGVQYSARGEEARALLAGQTVNGVKMC